MTQYTEDGPGPAPYVDVDRPVVLRAARLLTGAYADVVTDGGVLVDDGRIAAAGPWAAVAGSVPDGVGVLDLGDVTLMPGLIDCHVHLAMDASADRVDNDFDVPDADLVCRMVHSARRLLDAGVTTARDLGCPGTLAVSVRDAIARGQVPGPRMRVANAPITVTGGHAWPMGGEADGVLEVTRQVRLRAREGADLVKIMSTGGFMTAGSKPWQARYTVEELRAAAEEAHRLNMPVTTHALGVEGIDRAARAGIDMIEHCGWVTADGTRFDPDVAARLVEADVAVCPTMNTACLPAPYFCPWDVREHLVANLRAMLDAGVTIVAGTDAGIGLVPFERYADGLDVLAEAGMSARDVLAAATERAAAAIGLSGVTGRIEPGLAADLLAVPGDPVADLSVLHRPSYVVAAGRGHRCRPHPPIDAKAHRTAERIRTLLTERSGR